MADVDPETKCEFLRLRKINRDLNRRYVAALLVEGTDRYRILDEFQNAIVQKLIGMRLMLDVLQKNRYSLNADLIALRDLIISTIKSAHHLADDIAPHVLLEMGLEASLQELFKKYTRDYCFSYCISTRDTEVRLINEATKLVLYQLIKRLLDGIVHLCRDAVVRVNIRTRNSAIEIIVEDNGIEFDFAEIISNGQSGERSFLLEVVETVRLLGGSVWSEKSQGISSVCIIIPLKNNYDLFLTDKYFNNPLNCFNNDD